MKWDIEAEWKKLLKDYIETKDFKETTQKIEQEYQNLNISVYPPQKDIFNTLSFTSPSEVKVIILGQDPYHQQGQAHGLAFSVLDGIKLPPSLKNIYKEIENDLSIKKNYLSGNLSSWSKQGVLLLNSVLSVRKSEPGSHANKGWEKFTDTIIQKISDNKKHCVFILWGKYAQSKKELIDTSKHLILESAHPSPLSAYRGFFGNKHFSKTNKYLTEHNKKPIIW